MTPYQFEGLLRQWHNRREHTELLTGILASTIANTGYARPDNPTSPADFMPSQSGKKTPSEPRMSAEGFSSAMHALAERQAASRGRG
jgi:hypothetical protein